MNGRFTLMLVLLPLLAAPVHAGIIFGKKPPKPDPAVRVPELVKIVRTDGDENKRADAIDELRQFDPATFPEIMPALIDALLNDKKPAVRAAAATTIAKLRPVSQQAGDALEEALDKDPSMRVRLQVRSALLQYHWAGYRQGKKDEPTPPTTTKEPPLADPKPGAPPAKQPESPPTLTPRPLPPMPVPVPPAAGNPPPLPLPQGPAIDVPTPPVTIKPPEALTGPDLGAPPQ